MYWIYAASQMRFDQDYRKVAQLAGIQGHDDMKQDIRPKVKRWLEMPESGKDLHPSCSSAESG